MRNNIPTVVSSAARRRNWPMRDNISAVVSSAAGRGNRPMREQLQAAAISYGAYHKRQNNYCADCTTQYQRTTKFCHYNLSTQPRPGVLVHSGLRP